MKRMFLSLLVILVASSAFAMSKSRAREEAWFLTDKMAYELFLTVEQMEDVYEINYDYFRALSSHRRVYTREYQRRLDDLAYVLTPRQWRRFETILDFVNPVKAVNNKWSFGIYSRYTSGMHYFNKPNSYSVYVTSNKHNSNYYMGRQKMHANHVQNRVGVLKPDHRNTAPVVNNKPVVGNHNNSGNNSNKGHAAYGVQPKNNGNFNVNNGKNDPKKDLRNDVKKDAKSDVKKDVRNDVKKDVKKDVKSDVKNDRRGTTPTRRFNGTNGSRARSN